MGEIIALDLETSGLIPGVHKPLAIGAAVVKQFGNIALPSYNIDRLISQQNAFYVQLAWDSVEVSPEALRINKLDIVNPPGPEGYFYDRSLPAPDGLNAFLFWLDQFGDNIVALGKNVGSFDLPMLKAVWNDKLTRYWPFSYRSIDLNSLLLTMAQIENRSYDSIKEDMVQRILAKIQERYPWACEHHALVDVWINVCMYHECIARLGSS